MDDKDKVVIRLKYRAKTSFDEIENIIPRGVGCRYDLPKMPKMDYVEYNAFVISCVGVVLLVLMLIFGYWD
jgi:hypothetical protein